MNQAKPATESVYSLQSTDGTQRFLLTVDRCYRVGRLPQSEIVILGSSASRLHAILAYDGKRWWLQDMSSNGTLVNRTAVTSRQMLQSGDVIRFGEVSEWMFTQVESAEDTCVGLETEATYTPDEAGFITMSVGNPLIVGTSSITSGLRFHSGKAATKSTGVIIRGEFGSGKRHLARFIHSRSENGHKQIRFADAGKLTARGLRIVLSAAEKVGTVVLGDFLRLSPDAQDVLMEYFQDRARQAGSDAGDVGPRIISLTTESPERAIDEGHFKTDLFFKLGVAQILIDPLREHIDDIPELVTHFTRQMADRLHCPIKEFSGSALDLLQHYQWPGNLAELQNVVERALMCARGQIVERGDLVAGFSEMLREGTPYAGFSLDEVEREHINATLIAQRWVKSHVAKTLGIERSTLDRKIAKYNLRRDGQFEKDESDTEDLLQRS